MQFLAKASVSFSLCLPLCLAFPAGSAAAATIEMRSSGTIAIHGRIEAGDEIAFRTKFRQQKIAVVEFSSPGGEIIPALEIGESDCYGKNRDHSRGRRNMRIGMRADLAGGEGASSQQEQ